MLGGSGWCWWCSCWSCSSPAWHTRPCTCGGAFGKVSRTGAAIGEHMAAFQNTAPSDGQPEPPLFTQPLSVASERYSQAHAEVICRREAKRSRHVEAWARWRRFNND